MISYAIYIVDDEETIREGLAMALETDYTVKTFSRAETAIKAVKTDPPDLILLDIGLPGISGIEALEEIKRLHPDILVIMITAFEDVGSVLSTMKLGAYDYIVKPIQMDGLEVTIHNALETISLRKEVKVLQEKYLEENLPCFIGESNKIQDMMTFIGMVAASPDTPILIAGETGTGKELIASAIHYRSPNFKGRLVTVNCAAIPKDLIESEIFGYEKGAFSGASPSGKKGLIEDAADGTLFLDELGDLSLEAQAKLLRFLEEGEYYRVGSTKKRYVRTRVVSATNKNLSAMIKEDLFRKDLFFRIGVIKINVPSLNERRDDILPLAAYFLNEFNQKFGRSFTGISSEAKAAMMQYNWTGNVRELKNLIERGVLVGKEPEIMPGDFGIKINAIDEPDAFDENGQEYPPIPPDGIDLYSRLNALETYYIKSALDLSAGNESKAARLLNINHHTFRYRKKKLLPE